MFIVIIGENGDSIGFLGGIGKDGVVHEEHALGIPFYEDAQVLDSVRLLGVLEY